MEEGKVVYIELHNIPDAVLGTFIYSPHNSLSNPEHDIALSSLYKQ